MNASDCSEDGGGDNRTSAIFFFFPECRVEMLHHSHLINTEANTPFN
jgi:hypothetical protein